MKNVERPVGIILADKDNKILLIRNEDDVLVLPETITDWKNPDTKCTALYYLKERLCIPIPDYETYDSRILNLHEFSEGPYKLEREDLLVWIIRLSRKIEPNVIFGTESFIWVSGIQDSSKYGPDVKEYIKKYYKIFDKPKEPIKLEVDRLIHPYSILDVQEERIGALKLLRERILELEYNRYCNTIDNHPVRQKRNSEEIKTIENELTWRMQDYEALMYDQKKDWDLNYNDYGI